MMFNGLMMCGDSDTSDFTKESVGASSGACSGAGSGAGGGAGWDAEARADLYHSKLLSTLQVLQNKEETVVVQGESLRVAEARICALGARAARLQQELAAKTQQLRSLRRADKNGPQRADVSVTAETQERQERRERRAVRALETNLAITEDLYRECFYETAKQEELIETLRKSYLEAKEPYAAPHAPRQPQAPREPSSDRDQDIAMEMDSLKLEITNFLNSSNNDSGVWGEELDVRAELRPIGAQLRRLQELLVGDCTCGLLEENIKLKNDNETMETQIGELRRKVNELETALTEKEEEVTYKIELEEKNEELHSIRQKLLQMEEDINEKNAACDSFTTQLRQAQVSAEAQALQLRAARAQLQDARDHAARQSRSARETLSRQLAAEAEARRHMERTYRAQALELRGWLLAAQARGARLCRDVRAAVAAVHACHREQENRIKEQESLIRSLQYELESSQKKTSVKKESCCPHCACQRPAFGSDVASCSKCARGRAGRGARVGASASETAPTPPRRQLKKKTSLCNANTARGRSPPACELEQRVDALRAALGHAAPRWATRR